MINVAEGFAWNAEVPATSDTTRSVAFREFDELHIH
jgi:hypothetical protein